MSRRLTEYQRGLVESELPLRDNLVNKWAAGRHWLVEGYQDAATDALIEAALRFDPSRGTNFGAMAMIYIQHGMSRWNVYRRCGNRKPVGSSMPLDANEPAWCDRRDDESPSFEQLIALLGPRDREILRHRFVGGLAYRKVGSKMGLSFGRVKQLERRSLQSIKLTG